MNRTHVHITRDTQAGIAVDGIGLIICDGEVGSHHDTILEFASLELYADFIDLCSRDLLGRLQLKRIMERVQ